MAPSSSAALQQATVAQMSIFEKLGVAPKIVGVLVKTLATLLTYPLRSASSLPPTLKKHIAYTLVRNYISAASPSQQLYLAPSTDASYEKVCKAHNQAPDSEILTDGTRAHWIGPRDAKKVIVHLHGGGYVMPCGDYVISYLFQLRDALRKTLPDRDFAPQGSGSSSVLPSILLLSYDLSPGAQFPRQLIQATMLLNHLLTVKGLAPSDIIITGDSAGANLALALISHITHPHPSVPQAEFPPGEKLLGLVLISPWVSFDHATPAFTTNATSDTIAAEFVSKCSSAFLGTPYPHAHDKDTPYTQPAHAPPEWWAEIPVDQILVTAGADEVLVDGIRALQRNLAEGLGAGSDGISGGRRVEMLVARGEAHESPLFNMAIGDELGESAGRIEGWVRSKL